jgi:hypothetical protein
MAKLAVDSKGLSIVKDKLNATPPDALPSSPSREQPKATWVHGFSGTQTHIASPLATKPTGTDASKAVPVGALDGKPAEVESSIKR